MLRAERRGICGLRGPSRCRAAQSFGLSVFRWGRRSRTLCRPHNKLQVQTPPSLETKIDRDRAEQAEERGCHSLEINLPSIRVGPSTAMRSNLPSKVARSPFLTAGFLFLSKRIPTVTSSPLTLVG